MNYSATAKKTAAMIAKSGMAMTLRVTSAGEYDPITGTSTGETVTDYQCKGLLKTPGMNSAGVTFEDGTTIQASDKSALVPAFGLAVKPNVGDRLIAGDVEWSVKLVQTLEPGGVPLLHTLYLRKA